MSRLALIEGQKENKLKEKEEWKMGKAVKTVLVMTILTVIYISAVVYASVNSSDYGKKPIEYGIWRSYFAEKLETKPQEWNTTEELGIAFGEKMNCETETYRILIVDEEKALPWMNGTKEIPYVANLNVKYKDKFYRIVFLWLTPGLPEYVKQWQIPMAGALGAGWVLTGVLFLKARKKE